MADVVAHETASSTPTEEELRRGVELLFFAYRDFTAEPDAILARDGLGRAHHRALYFIGRNPDLAVADLLAILRITKQSLGRVLKQLMVRGLVEQQQGHMDRRQRLLRLTDEGRALERQLNQCQRARIMRAYHEAGPEAVEAWRQVLAILINETDRAALSQGSSAP